MYGPPYYTSPPDNPRADRCAEIREALETEWLADPKRLADAAEEIIGAYESMPRDLAAAMIGHMDDQDARSLRFMCALMGKVEDEIRKQAREEAEYREEREWQERRNAA